MSATSIVFSSVKSVANNKKLQQDANGYYKVIVGAINAFNSSGAFYLADGVKELIESDSSILARRLKSNYLYGEKGHPSYIPGMTNEQFISRNLRIEMNNVSHHIKEIILTPTNITSGLQGKGNVIKIEAWIKPSGEQGPLLQKALDNPDENVAFSIRSLTCDQMVNGTMIKKLVTIVTWDWVIEPGISIANKYDSIALEAYTKDERRFDIDELRTNKDIITKLNVSAEDAESIRASIDQAIKSFKKIQNSNDLLLRW